MTIINNELTSDTAKLRISNPFFYVPDPDEAGPLSFAYLYFGLPGKDPEEEINRVRVYAIQEDGTVIPISQPVRTTAGGVPEYNNTIVSLAIDGAYSYKALNSSFEQKYNQPSVENLTLLEIGVTTVIEDVLELTAGQTAITFPNANVNDSVIDISSTDLIDPSTVDSRSLFKDVDYAILDGGEGKITLINAFPDGTLIRARQNVTTAQEDSLTGVPVVYAQPDIASAVTVNFGEGDVVRITSDSSADDGLTNTYEVVPEGTGAADGVNFINLDNLLQFRLIRDRLKIKAYSETVSTAPVLSGSLTIDLNAGTVQKVTLTENISSIIIGNALAGQSSTVELIVNQDGVGGYAISFSGFYSAGGISPTITTDPGAQDKLIFSTDDGVNWGVFIAGQDIKVIA